MGYIRVVKVLTFSGAASAATYTQGSAWPCDGFTKLAYYVYVATSGSTVSAVKSLSLAIERSLDNKIWYKHSTLAAITAATAKPEIITTEYPPMYIRAKYKVAGVSAAFTGAVYILGIGD